MADPPNAAEQIPLDGEGGEVAKGRRLPQGARSTAFLVGAVLTACAAIPYFLLRPSCEHDSVLVALPSREQPARLVHVRCQGGVGGGVAVCRAGGRACQTAQAGAAVGGGSIVTTDSDTQARLLLRPGIELTLRQDTRLVLGSNTGYPARIDSGTLVADTVLRSRSTHEPRQPSTPAAENDPPSPGKEGFALPPPEPTI